MQAWRLLARAVADAAGVADPGSVVTPGAKALTIFNLHFVFLKLII